MNQAVGLIEIKGLAGAIDVADTMLKVAVVELLKLEKAKGFGWITVMIAGDVGAVQAAIDAGKSQAIATNCLVTSLVLPRPGEGIEALFLEEKVEETVTAQPETSLIEKEENETLQKEKSEKKSADRKEKKSKKKMEKSNNH